MVPLRCSEFREMQFISPNTVQISFYSSLKSLFGKTENSSLLYYDTDIFILPGKPGEADEQALVFTGHAS